MSISSITGRLLSLIRSITGYSSFIAPGDMTGVPFSDVESSTSDSSGEEVDTGSPAYHIDFLSVLDPIAFPQVGQRSVYTALTGHNTYTTLAQDAVLQRDYCAIVAPRLMQVCSNTYADPITYATPMVLSISFKVNDPSIIQLNWKMFSTPDVDLMLQRLSDTVVACTIQVNGILYVNANVYSNLSDVITLTLITLGSQAYLYRNTTILGTFNIGTVLDRAYMSSGVVHYGCGILLYDYRVYENVTETDIDTASKRVAFAQNIYSSVRQAEIGW